MQFWHLSGKEFRWSNSFDHVNGCVPFLQNQRKNISPTLLPSLSSMLRNKREVLQIHVHANVKHIQIWLLHSLYIKLIWALNISDVLIWETAGGGESRVGTGGKKAVLRSSDKKPRSGITWKVTDFLSTGMITNFPNECMKKCSVDLGNLLPSSFVLLFKQLVLSDY